MHFQIILIALAAFALSVDSRDPLSYASEPENVYSPAKNASVTTLLDLIRSRSDLSSLAATIQEPAGTLLHPCLTSIG